MLGKVQYLKPNLAAVELLSSGDESPTKLAPLADKWFVLPSNAKAHFPSDVTPSMSGIGSLLCVSPSVSVTATANGASTSANTASCSLSGTTVTSYRATKAVLSSKGLGNETVTFSAVDGKLLPTTIVAAPSKASSSSTSNSGSIGAAASLSAKTTATFRYPSNPPALPTPTGATKLPSSLAAGLDS